MKYIYQIISNFGLHFEIPFSVPEVAIDTELYSYYQDLVYRFFSLNIQLL